MKWTGDKVFMVTFVALVVGLVAGVSLQMYRDTLGECGRRSVCEEPSTVVVSSHDIPPNTELDPLVIAGRFRTVQLSNETVVPGAIQSVDQLRGETTSAFIYENEQIPAGRLGESCHPKQNGTCLDEPINP